MTGRHAADAPVEIDADVELTTAASDPAAGLADPGSKRFNLMVLAGFLSVVHLAFLGLQVASHASTADVSSTSLFTRMAIDAAVCAVLFSQRRIGSWGLVAAEAVLFGSEMLILLDAQYFTLLALIDRGDLVDAVACQKNGVARCIVLMISNAIFVSHRPLVTGRIVATMAASLIICHGLVLDHAISAHQILDDVGTYRIVMVNALFILAVAVLSILASWVLRRGRDTIGEGGRIGDYRLLRRLDGGGMGEVYLAEHDTLKRACAVKVLRADRQPDPVDRELFTREIQAAARLHHPNTVTVFDAGQTPDGNAYYAMEYLTGLDVADLVRQAGPLPAGRVVHLGRQIAGALEDTHRHGLVHRDLSAANVFVSVIGGACDVVKVLDFGVAFAARTPDTAAARGVAGTPEYIAPEQAVAGGDVDGRTDVYGLGALLYTMLCGQPPFVGSAADVLRAKLAEPAPSLRQRRPDVPPDLEAVVMRCLAREPADRYPDAAGVAAALAACRAAGSWTDAAAADWWHRHVIAATRQPAAS